MDWLARIGVFVLAAAIIWLWIAMSRVQRTRSVRVLRQAQIGVEVLATLIRMEREIGEALAPYFEELFSIQLNPRFKESVAEIMREVGEEMNAKRDEIERRAHRVVADLVAESEHLGSPVDIQKLTAQFPMLRLELLKPTV